MVHVEVHDGYALDAHGPRVRGRHRHVVQEAEPHGPVGPGVVAGRARQGGTRPDRALDHGLHHREHTACRAASRANAVHAVVRVGIQVALAPAQALQMGDERLVVHPRQLLGTRLPNLHGHPRRRRAPDGGARGPKALGPFGVVRAGTMLVEGRIVDQERPRALQRRRPFAGKA